MVHDLIMLFADLFDCLISYILEDVDEVLISGVPHYGGRILRGRHGKKADGEPLFPKITVLDIFKFL